MQKTKIFSLLTSSIFIMIAALLILVSVPVFAETGGTTMTEEEKKKLYDKQMADKKRKLEAQKAEEQAKLKAKKAEQEAQLAEKQRQAQAQAQAKKIEIRKKVCEERKKGMLQKTTRIANNVERFHNKIKSIQQKAEDYKSTAGLNVAGYDELLSSADSAQEASAQAVSALKSAESSIDCSNDAPAEGVSTFKVSAQDARDKLTTYKSAVKALLQALYNSSSESGEGED